jgi:transketolase
VVTAEEHQITGGLGSAVAEVIMEAEELQLGKPVLMKRVGMNGFGESGAVDQLMEKNGLSTDGIVEKIRQLMRLNG